MGGVQAGRLFPRLLMLRRAPKLRPMRDVLKERNLSLRYTQLWMPKDDRLWERRAPRKVSLWLRLKKRKKKKKLPFFHVWSLMGKYMNQSILKRQLFLNLEILIKNQRLFTCKYALNTKNVLSTILSTWDKFVCKTKTLALRAFIRVEEDIASEITMPNTLYIMPESGNSRGKRKSSMIMGSQGFCGVGACPQF